MRYLCWSICINFFISKLSILHFQFHHVNSLPHFVIKCCHVGLKYHQKKKKTNYNYHKQKGEVKQATYQNMASTKYLSHLQGLDTFSLSLSFQYEWCTYYKWQVTTLKAMKVNVILILITSQYHHTKFNFIIHTCLHMYSLHLPTHEISR